MPKSCAGCGGTLCMEHALDCRFGGLVGRCHNEVRDAIGDLASLVWGNVVHEPVVCDQSTSSDGALVADLCVNRVWILNLRYCSIFVGWILMPSPTMITLLRYSYSAEHEKQNYSQACPVGGPLHAFVCVC